MVLKDLSKIVVQSHGPEFDPEYGSTSNIKSTIKLKGNISSQGSKGRVSPPPSPGTSCAARREVGKVLRNPVINLSHLPASIPGKNPPNSAKHFPIPVKRIHYTVEQEKVLYEEEKIILKKKQ